VVLDDGLLPAASLFAESASRILISVDAGKVEAVLDVLASHEAPYSVIGEVGGSDFAIDLVIDGEQTAAIDLPLAEVKTVYTEAMEKLLSS